MAREVALLSVDGLCLKNRCPGRRGRPMVHACAAPPSCSAGYGNTSEEREQCDVAPLILVIWRRRRGANPSTRASRDAARHSKCQIRGSTMKTITMLMATAALVTGMSAANAQGTTKQMDEQAGGNSGAVERNPNGTTGGTKANPSPSTTGAAGSQRMPAEKDSSGAPKPTPAPGDVRK